MVSQEFVKKLLNKQVHIDFLNDKTAQIEWVEGKFSEFVDENTAEDYDDEDINNSEKIFIEIESETDLDRISLTTIKKIYLKE